MFYLKHIIPGIGRLLLGNPENYRMLGVYTEKFGNCGTI
jgi:demethylmenaquinone methyltransferase/2-methoxy-6-polyprenyl-1,4-benzoquinol methylase